MNAGKVKTFKHLGLHDTLYRNKMLGRKFLEKVSNEWTSLGTKSRSPYGNSFFGQSLYHIQLLKNAYGIKKRSFLKQLTFKSKSRRGTKSTNLLNLLENKLDYFLFNSGYVKTLDRAKELIESGHIKVNGELVRNGGYILKSTDKISLRGNSPTVIGETKYNVVSNFSVTTRWSFYTELLEDTMLLSASENRDSSFVYEKQGTSFELLNPENSISKNSLIQALDVLATRSGDDFFEFKKNLAFEKKAHFSVFLENNSVSKKYLSPTSYLLKKGRNVFENKNSQAQKYLAKSYLSTKSFEGLERYVTTSLLFNDLSLLKPTWEDCVDQNTSDLSTELAIHESALSATSLDAAENYNPNHFTSENNLTSSDNLSSPEGVPTESVFTIPHDEELDLTEELEEIRENADYYSQLEIEVVENRAPYIESYTNSRNLYCQYTQSIFLENTSTDNSPGATNKTICKNCNCDLENHVFYEGSIETKDISSSKPLTSLEIFSISEYYANLLCLENTESFEDSLLSASSMSQSVILRDKKEGVQFNLISRSPEVSGEGFYLDPELWELRSRILDEFSESKINSAEHVIKATR